MRSRIAIQEQEISNNERINLFLRSSNTRNDSSQNNLVSDILEVEGSENFNNYLEWLGLDKDPNKVVLSSMHHYFYDVEEMKDVKTVINLKELNYVKEIKSFLHSISNILPNKSNLIGCFIDNKKQNVFGFRNDFSGYHSANNSEAIENGIISRIPFLNLLYSLMDSKTNKFFSKLSITLLLEDYGFKVMDMTELNGLTFFCAQRLHPGDN
jgi:hypothetical protein